MQYLKIPVDFDAEKARSVNQILKLLSSQDAAYLESFAETLADQIESRRLLREEPLPQPQSSRTSGEAPA